MQREHTTVCGKCWDTLLNCESNLLLTDMCVAVTVAQHVSIALGFPYYVHQCLRVFLMKQPPCNMHPVAAI